jgi:hypothetical protein
VPFEGNYLPNGTAGLGRIIVSSNVAAFTGFDNRPPNDPVIYPQACPAACPGMVKIVESMQLNPTLAAGTNGRAFTYYDSSQLKKYPIVSTRPCKEQIAFPGLNPECVPPQNDTVHQEALDWIVAEVKPSIDDRLFIIGHSYGGNRARLFADELVKRGYSVDALLTADPINWKKCSILDIVRGFFQAECKQGADVYLAPIGIRKVLSYVQTKEVPARRHPETDLRRDDLCNLLLLRYSIMEDIQRRHKRIRILSGFRKPDTIASR